MKLICSEVAIKGPVLPGNVHRLLKDHMEKILLSKLEDLEFKQKLVFGDSNASDNKKSEWFQGVYTEDRGS